LFGVSGNYSAQAVLFPDAVMEENCHPHFCHAFKACLSVVVYFMLNLIYAHGPAPMRSKRTNHKSLPLWCMSAH
jgi:hypothetical protein